jgi:ABC-type sugar transport system substrate-binding protein
MAVRLVAQVLTLGLVLAAVAGCGGEPPPLEELSLGPDSSGAVAEVLMVFPPRRTPEHGIWEAIASDRIGQARMVFSVDRCDPDDPPQRQAEMVRAGADRRVSALIVVPGDPQVLAPALAYARAQGVKIVVLGAEVPIAGEPPLPTVVQTPPEEAAAELVAALVAAAKEEAPPLTGPALLMVPESQDDPRIPARIAALKSRIQEAGLELLSDLPFQIEGNTPHEVLGAAIMQDPRPAVVIGVDDTAVTGAARVRGEKFQEAPFILGGYIDNPEMLSMLRSNFCSAAVDGNLPAAAREAVRLTLEQLEGRTIPDRTVIPTPIRVATGKPRPGMYSRPAGPGGVPRDISGAEPFPKSP